MSEFEIATIPLGFILGLGVALTLTSFSATLRDRYEHSLAWLPFVWALMILVLQVQFWFGLYDLDRVVGGWGWLWYGQVLFLAVLLFVAGALVLPTRGSRVPGGLMEDFQAHGRLALVALALYFVFWLVPNAKLNGSLFILPNLLNLILAALTLVTFRLSNRRARTWATVSFALVLLYALAFVYSKPGPDRPI